MSDIKIADSATKQSEDLVYASLHNHSYYSLLDGLSSPEELAAIAKKNGCPAVALTDHGTCAGLYRFQKACQKNGIKPILGMEAYFVKNLETKNKEDKRWHLTLIAKNKTGYQNLITLNTFGYIKGFYNRPRIDFELLRKYSDGLMAGSACAGGVICGPLMDESLGDEGERLAIQHLDAFHSLFKEDFYVEIMSHRYNPERKDFADRLKKAMRRIYDLAQERSILTVLTCDSHYCLPDDAIAHDVLLSIRSKNTIKNPKRYTYSSSDFYFKSPQDLYSLCGESHRHLLDNSIKIADRVESDIIQPSKDLLPNFELPPGFASEEDYLKKLLENGMRVKGLLSRPEYCERIREEFRVIKATGYPKYFLILWDIIQFANRKGIRVGPGRGSGVSSLCLYCLGVTALDPIKHNLMFSRFLSPDRVNPPDVDLDFDHDRQHEIFNYVISKYGAECIARIGTYSSLKTRDVIRRVGKALDIGGDWEERAVGAENNWESGPRTLALVDRISKSVPEDPDMTIENALRDSMELRQYAASYPKVFELAKKMEGTLSAAGVHPAGVVICRDPVVTHSPLRIAKDNVICTQYEMGEIEELGLLKIDVLALSALTAIEKCINLIKTRSGKSIKLNDLEPNDPNVFKMLNQGLTDGIFQFGKHGITTLLKEIRVDSFEDMVMCNALYRPGTLRAGIHQLYCDYKHGRREVSYVHPKMKDVLHNTYGMMIYQEDVIRIAVSLAGFTDMEADKLRKAVGKKIPELMEKSRTQFIEGCVKNGIPRETGQKVFELIDFFSGYGFNRSHSAAYAYLAYQMAWLKWYYPLEFYCALLSAEKDEDKRHNYERCAATFKGHNMTKPIEILPINIDRSKMDYNIEGENLRQPLVTLKGVGEKAVEVIVKHQPYDSLANFSIQTLSPAVNSTVLSVLIKSGCLSHWGDPEFIMKQWEFYRKGARKQKQKDKIYGESEGSLFD